METILIKYGGNAMLDDELKKAVISDVVELSKSYRICLCHGGGPSINKLLEKLNVKSEFINGLRYSSKEVVDVVKMALIGEVNSELVSLINAQGGRAIGISGISNKLLQCKKKESEVDLGYVGEIEKVNSEVIELLLDNYYLPVIAPLGTDGINTYNINGDTAAGKLASAIKVDKLLLLTDIEGVCNDIKKRDVISTLNVKDIPLLKEKGIISGGMIPKIDCCIQAIEEGVKEVQIIDGRVQHIIFKALKEEDIGTTITKERQSKGIA